jgi:hypothetical protein
MKTASKLGVFVRVPFLYPAEHPQNIVELKEQFPGVEIQAGGVDHVVVGGARVCDELTDVYEWVREHLPQS